MWTTRLAMFVVLGAAVSCADEGGDEGHPWVPPAPRCADPSALEMIVAPRFYDLLEAFDVMVVDGAVYGATTTSLIRFADETYDVLAEIPCASRRICKRLDYWVAGDGFDILRHDSVAAGVGEYEPGSTLVTLWHVPRAGGDATAIAEWEIFPTANVVRQDTRLLLHGVFPSVGYGLLALPLDGGVPILLTHDGSVDEYFDQRVADLEKLGPYLLAKMDLPAGEAIYIVEPESGARRRVEVPNAESVRFIGSGDNEAFFTVFIEDKIDPYFDIWRIDTTGAASLVLHDVGSTVGYFSGFFSSEYDDTFDVKSGLETSDLYLYDGSGAELSESDCLSGYDYINYTVIGVDADYVYFEARDPVLQRSYARLARH